MKVEIIYIVSYNTPSHIFHKYLDVISKHESLFMLSCYIRIQQMMNFIKTPTGEMNENFKLFTKHNMLQDIIQYLQGTHFPR